LAVNVGEGVAFTEEMANQTGIQEKQQPSNKDRLKQRKKELAERETEVKELEK